MVGLDCCVQRRLPLETGHRRHLYASEGIRYRSIEAPRSNTNAVVILDRRLVVKIYSPFWSEFDIEPKLIEVLSAEGSVPVPEVVASGQYQDKVTWTYLVMEHCPGLTLEALRPEISREEVMSIAAQVGDCNEVPSSDRSR